MIIKYAYAYADPKGTYYVGLREGVVTHGISAAAMSSIAAQEGGMLSWLRRTIVSQIGDSELFELVNVTPKKITDRGIVSAEEIKELYDLVKFDPELDKAMKSYATQVHEALEEARIADPCKTVRDYVQGLVHESIVVEAKINDKDPSMIDVQLKIPVSRVEISIKGVQDGSENRA